MRRTEFKDFNTVEDAIVLADKGLKLEAAKLCVEKGIPIDVAFRVITKPKQRRKQPKILPSPWEDNIIHHD